MGEQDTSGNPGNGGIPPTGSGVNVTPQGGADKIEFTPAQQEYVNKIVSSRVNEVKSQYSQAQEDSRILQNLIKDPEFTAWLNGDRSVPGDKSGPSDTVEALMEKEELSGKDIVMLVQSLLGKEIAPLKTQVDKAMQTTHAVGMNTTLQEMASRVDPKTGQPLYPNLWDQEFRTEVQSLLGKRAANPEDAYYLAERDRKASGKGIPNTAFLLEGSGRGGYTPRNGLIGGDTEEPVTIESLGLTGKPNIKQILNAVMDRKIKQSGG